MDIGLEFLPLHSNLAIMFSIRASRALQSLFLVDLDTLYSISKRISDSPQKLQFVVLVSESLARH